MGNPGANVVWQHTAIGRQDRQRVLAQKGAVIWFTGLSGSGKSTVANALEARLNAAGKLTFLLDGDNVRHGLSADLGFSEADRRENNRRVSHVAKLFWEANLLTLVSFISPFRTERAFTRSLIGPDFIEVHVDAPLEICEGRDPKGLYKKAREGKIPEFTGISSPYERPEDPELTVRSQEEAAAAAAERIHQYLSGRGYC